MRILMLTVLPWALTACGASNSGNAVAAVPLPPPSLVQPCPPPVDLPESALSQREVERLWGRDRSALRRCGGQVLGLAEWASIPAQAQGG
jgi:hypothetical protein